MSIATNIRKIVFIGIWVIAGAGLIVLLVAAVHSRSDQVCKGYEINIKDADTATRFLDNNYILNVVTENKSVKLKGVAIKSIDLNKVEARLKKETWVRNAELFFDNSGILRVTVNQRQPVARVFNSAGESFYIDSNCKKLPLSAKASVKLPVFTGYPFGIKKARPEEKKLLNEMKDLSLYLSKDPFWMAQVAQIDITPAREFELMPTVGEHVIEFGNGKDLEQKFHRLMIFYQQVLAKTGMNRYHRIKVQYQQQVIAVKNENN